MIKITSKKWYIIAPCILVLIFIVAGFMVNSQNSVKIPPKATSTEPTAQNDTAPIKPRFAKNTAKESPIAPVQTTVAERPVESEPIPDIRTRLKNKVEEYGLSVGMKNVELQSRCMDRMVNETIGYANEEKALQFVDDMFINGKLDINGVLTRIYFDETCKVIYYKS